MDSFWLIVGRKIITVIIFLLRRTMRTREPGRLAGHRHVVMVSTHDAKYSIRKHKSNTN